MKEDAKEEWFLFIVIQKARHARTLVQKASHVSTPHPIFECSKPCAPSPLIFQYGSAFPLNHSLILISRFTDVALSS
jgi:hypothetical protein